MCWFNCDFGAIYMRAASLTHSSYLQVPALIFQGSSMVLLLTIKVPEKTKLTAPENVVIRLLHISITLLVNVNNEANSGPISDCSCRSSLIWIYTYVKELQIHSVNDKSRRLLLRLALQGLISRKILIFARSCNHWIQIPALSTCGRQSLKTIFDYVHENLVPVAYLWATNAQTSLCTCTDSPEPLLLTYTK